MKIRLITVVMDVKTSLLTTALQWGAQTFVILNNIDFVFVLLKLLLFTQQVLDNLRDVLSAPEWQQLQTLMQEIKQQHQIELNRVKSQCEVSVMRI